MSHARNTALLKVLAAAAWADGRLDTEEVNRIKELMLAYRLNDADVSAIDAILARPVSYTRCEALTRDLMEHLKNKSDRDEALKEIERVLAADGVVSESERELLESLGGIMDALTSVDGLINRITGIFKRSFSSKRDANGSPGELTEYLKNAVLQRLHEVSDGDWSKTLDAKTLNTYTLFGAVLGRVADAEGGISDEELDRIRALLVATFGIEEPLLSWVVQSVREAATTGVDRQGLLSEFNRVSDSDDRRRLLDAAFAVAAADGELAEAELEELRLIANFLWLDPRDYNAVRVRWQQQLEA